MRGREYDAIVVGGGPAGSVTAMLLARRGLAVRLLDRATFPRTKPCGESLNPGAVRELGSLGILPDVLELPHRRVIRWIVVPDRGPAFVGHFPPGEFGIAIDRAALDERILEIARRSGVDVMTGARVVDVVVTDGRVAGVRSSDGGVTNARLVVGADGLRSVVARRLGLVKRRPKLRKVALTAHVQGADVPESAGLLGVREWGCFGVVEIAAECSNVVLVLNSRGQRELRGNPDHTFDRLLCEIAALRGATRVSSVRATGPFDVPTSRATTDGALLVGDAAGYFDPFTGQGIHHALSGARMAAEVAGAALAAGRPDRDALGEYDRWHRRALAASMRLQRVIEIGVARPPVFRAAAAVLRRWPSQADRLVAVTGDLLPARHLAPGVAFARA